MSPFQDFDDTGSFPIRGGTSNGKSISGTVRIAIADRYPMVLDGLEQLFLLDPALQIVGRASTQEELAAVLAASSPDVLVIDARMLEDTVADLGRLSLTDIRIVVFIDEIDEDETIALIRAGVRGVVLKHMPSQLLFACVRKVAAGHLWLDKSSVARALEKILRQEAQFQQVTDLLNPREIDVLRLAGQGLRNREIADRLSIDDTAVKSHLHAVYEKLNLRSRVELADFARHRGLVIS